MKKIHEFQTYEVNITEEERNELCQKIKDIAESQNIMTEPHIQFNLLLKKINIRMIEFCDDWVFTFKNEKSGQIEEVDFSTNSVMFSVKVLKSLFSNNKSGMYTLQSKNLDILSFYAYGVPWTNTINGKPINGKEIKKFSLKKYQNSIAITGFSICILIILFLLNTIKTQKEQFEEKQDKYQFALKLSRFEYMNFYKIDFKDVLKIPDSELILCRIFFNKDTKEDFPGGFKMYFVKNKGDYIEEPGIKNNFVIGTPKAFGFGRTSCENDCYEVAKPYYEMKNCTILRLKPQETTYVSYIRLKWVEMGYDNGSVGAIYINKQHEPVGFEPIQRLGILPPSRYIKDEMAHDLVLKVDTLVHTIDIAVWDIASDSEIYINEIEVYTNPK